MNDRDRQIIEVDWYRGMIVWAKTQPDDEKPDRMKMEDELGVSWFSYDSVFCSKYMDEEDEDSQGVPDNWKPGCRCPLCLDGFYCCDELWFKMETSTSWIEWIARAEKVVNFIESIKLQSEKIVKSKVVKNETECYEQGLLF